MESIYPKSALCDSKNEFARTDTVFFPIYEVSDGTDGMDTVSHISSNVNIMAYFYCYNPFAWFMSGDFVTERVMAKYFSIMTGLPRPSASSPVPVHPMSRSCVLLF